MRGVGGYWRGAWGVGNWPGTGMRQTKGLGCGTEGGAHSQGHARASLHFALYALHLRHPRPGSEAGRGKGGGRGKILS